MVQILKFTFMLRYVLNKAFFSENLPLHPCFVEICPNYDFQRYHLCYEVIHPNSLGCHKNKLVFIWSKNGQ